MLLEMGSEGAVDIANNCSVRASTMHVDVRSFLLRELKDKGLLVIKHVPGNENCAVIIIKNKAPPIFE